MSSAASINTNSCACLNQTLANSVLHADYCAFSLPVTIDRPRSVLAVPGGSNVLALERGAQSVILLTDKDGDGVPDSRRLVAFAPDLNHGLAVHDGYLYASSDTTVYRWPWNGNRVTGSQQVVINNINANGNGGAPQGHKTRTLAFDSEGRFYVSVGSDGNVDPNSFRSRIRRFRIDDDDDDASVFPIDFLTGEVFADGIRNAVAMAFDKHGVLWAADTGADDLERDDIGGDITNDNPAEELMQIPQEGLNFGYPYCFTEYRLDEPYAMGRGTAWAWPSFLDDGTVTDEDCRNIYDQADVAMQAHSTPLGIAFYNYKPPEELPDYCPEGVAFPESMDGNVFIAFHGSWNRDVPTGYKVVYVEVDANGNVLSDGEPIDLLAHVPPNAKWDDGFRPTDVDFDECGRLLLSSDGTNKGNEVYAGSKIVRIEGVAVQCRGDGAVEEPSSPPPSSNIFQRNPTIAPSTTSPSSAPVVTTLSPSTSSPSTISAMTLSPTSLATTATTTAVEVSNAPSTSDSVSDSDASFSPTIIMGNDVIAEDESMTPSSSSSQEEDDSIAPSPPPTTSVNDIPTKSPQR